MANDTKREERRQAKGIAGWLAGAEMVIRRQTVSALSYLLASYEDEGKKATLKPLGKGTSEREVA